jgi:hypothetical protein
LRFIEINSRWLPFAFISMFAQFSAVMVEKLCGNNEDGG